MNSKFTIRKATTKDTKLILSFIKELALYEKLSNEVIADEKTLRSTLFSKRRIAEVIFACYKGKEIGFALYFYNFSTFLGRPGIYIEDLFVKPAFRNKGCGKLLLHYLARKAVVNNCGRLEWWVLNWNKPAIRFYRKLGAVPMKDWTVNRIAGKALLSLAEKA